MADLIPTKWWPMLRAAESAGAMRFKLAPDELARLDDLSRLFRSPRL